MIDFHIHILPGIDDGSKNADMSIEMLRMEHADGTDTIVATPHFYAHHSSVKHFLEKRQKAFENLQAALADSVRQEDIGAGDIAKTKIIAGAEVYYFPGIGDARDIQRLCIDDTDTILVELPFEQWDEEVYRDLMTLIEKRHLTVALAHIERYPDFQKDRSVWKRIFKELPVYAQINMGSFLGRNRLFRSNKKKKFSLAFIREHGQVILGTDAHNLSGRAPNMREGCEVIRRELGEEILQGCEKAAMHLLPRSIRTK